MHPLAFDQPSALVQNRSIEVSHAGSRSASLLKMNRRDEFLRAIFAIGLLASIFAQWEQ